MNRPIAGKEKKSVRLHILLEPSELEALDDFRFSARIDSRAEAVRELVRRGMRASKDGHGTTDDKAHA